MANSLPKSFSMFSSIEQVAIHGGQMTQNIQTAGSSGFQELTKEVVASAFHNAGQEFEHPKCHPNTRIAVLDRIKGWMLPSDCQKTPVLWMYSAEGVGKSCIARSLAAWCEDEKFLLASFFFSRSDPSRNHIKHFIATLAYAVAVKSVPECRPIIEQVVESDPHIFSLSLETQIQRLILQPLSLVTEAASLSSCSLPHVIIIDGLDECIKPAESAFLIRLLSSTLSENAFLGLQVFITSRPDAIIRGSFDYASTFNLSSRLALTDEYIADDDIRRFLEDRIIEIKANNPSTLQHLPDWPTKEDLDKLVQQSSGQFIYAATVIQQMSLGEHPRQHGTTGKDSTKANGASKRDGNAKPASRTTDDAPRPGPINDSSFHDADISVDDAVLENFVGFDMSAATAINTSAFRGAKISGHNIRISNFSSCPPARR